MALENLKDFDRTLFGTKVLNLETKNLGIVLYTWTNVYADGDIPFATCVDENGKNIMFQWIIFKLPKISYTKMRNVLKNSTFQNCCYTRALELEICEIKFKKNSNVATLE